MDPLKDAFKKIKEEINTLKYEKEFLEITLGEINNKLDSLNNSIFNLTFLLEKIISAKQMPFEKEKNEFSKGKPIFLEKDSFPAYNLESSTDEKDISTQNNLFNPLNDQNKVISKGNEGVPADRQTHRQTHRQTQDMVENAAEMLNSLDSLKKELKIKFKKLTDQEFLVFSKMYQLDEEKGYSDHKTLSKELKLTESSIRDYIGRLLKKGVPIEKTKINNKSVQLSISKSLKKIVSLSTILTLREL